MIVAATNPITIPKLIIIAFKYGIKSVAIQPPHTLNLKYLIVMPVTMNLVDFPNSQQIRYYT
jgi:hypothetical protein